MIDWLIEASLRNRVLVVAAFLLLGGWGYWALLTTPIDAIPDLSDNQVIVFTDWTGRSPQEVEDQITYPLTVSLQGLPGVRVVRSSSAFGFSMINVIFEDAVDLYFARSRVLERLNLLARSLPPGVVPTLGPDATGVGHVFWYTVEGKGYSLRDLRSIQDWYIRYQLNWCGSSCRIGRAISASACTSRSAFRPGRASGRRWCRRARSRCSASAPSSTCPRPTARTGSSSAPSGSGPRWAISCRCSKG